LARAGAIAVALSLVSVLPGTQAGVARAQERAEAGASVWSPAPKSRARLLVAGPPANGAYAAGVEIALDGQALTYWRNPGDSGVPPEFDFGGSENLARATVSYPAPERHDEAGSEVFGWRGKVIFPVTVEPKDAARPVTLDLTLRYAACEKICIPSEGRMRLTISPKGAQTPQAARIAQWAALTPRPAAGVAFAIQPVAGAEKPTWRVSVAPAETGSDLFAEGEDGWFFDTRAAGADFKLVLAERPAGAQSPASIRLTLTRPSGAVEFQTTLDAGKPAP
jgi:DsbC/DsbD-like thiol-disulfide interchange protein